MAGTIQVLGRALELLIYLNKQGRGMGITQIASDMGTYKGTVFHILSTLEAKGLVSRDPETEKYQLGSQLSVLGKSVKNKMEIQEAMRPYARRLHQKYHEVVNVSILEHDPDDIYHSVTILKEMNDQQLLTANPPIGSLSECHYSAVGKCLLTFGDDIDWVPYEERELTQYTVNTILSYGDLKEEVDRVRCRGYVMGHKEQEMSLTCTGAPILDRNKKAIVAISLSGPASRVNSSDLESRIKAVYNTTRDISGNFQGYLRLSARHGRGGKVNCTKDIWQHMKATLLCCL